jgi:hypothetical protein
MEMSSNVTLVESGTCQILGGAPSDIISYEFYSFLSHDNFTYYFVKVLPMSAPFQLLGPNFGFQSCTGTQIFGEYDGTYTVRSFVQKQKDAIALSDPTAYVDKYSFYYGQYITWDVPASQYFTFGTLQIVQPLVLQVPIEPLFFGFLPPGLLRK